MYKVAKGIDVYYENKKEVPNIIFFSNDNQKYYNTGAMLFEAIHDEAIYLLTDKVENMIKCTKERSESLPTFPQIKLVSFIIQLPTKPYFQTVLNCYLHMYRTLAYPKLFCRLTDCGVVVDDIFGNADCPFLDIILQRKSP